MDLDAPEVDISVTESTTTTSERIDSIFFFFGELSQAERLLLACMLRAPGLSAHYRHKVSKTDISASHTLCW